MLLLLALLAQVNAFQNAYDVLHERMEVEYYDPTLLNVSCTNYKYNRTTRTFILTATLKTDVTEGDLLMVTGYKWLSNRYRLDILQFNLTIKDAIRFKYFDVNRMLNSCTTPRLEWPLIKGVKYTLRDWVPDSTKFPPGMPEGRWKIGMRSVTAYGKHILTTNWYCAVKYKLKMEWK
ncbi:hypothetical protein PPYR_14112 [Photinus pyralis]|uniref:Uncharacterized protein n=1 Tax=Photinus pyralis TaxID=7054 RepID=A0A5N4A4A8_PHOPY|nr:uncharacterized protein LOC116180903 [Photinus pyralis]KAB0792153.1 hypothetical protein PPYR_14112 [Photinus pyralis]